MSSRRIHELAAALPPGGTGGWTGSPKKPWKIEHPAWGRESYQTWEEAIAAAHVWAQRHEEMREGVLTRQLQRLRDLLPEATIEASETHHEERFKRTFRITIGAKVGTFIKFDEAEQFCIDAAEVLGRKAPPF